MTVVVEHMTAFGVSHDYGSLSHDCSWCITW